MAHSTHSKISPACCGASAHIVKTAAVLRMPSLNIINGKCLCPYSYAGVPPKCGITSSTKCEKNAMGAASSGCCTAKAIAVPVSTWFKPVIALYYGIARAILGRESLFMATIRAITPASQERKNKRLCRPQLPAINCYLPYYITDLWWLIRLKSEIAL